MSPQEPRTILLVEDDTVLRETLELFLQYEGYTVQTAANGEIAWRALNEGGVRPDLILLDLMMPVMDGWKFLELRRESEPISKIPVIVLTASTQDIDDLPCERLIRKPLDLETLISTIRATP